MTVTPRTWTTRDGKPHASWTFDFTYLGRRHTAGGFATRAVAVQAEGVARARAVDGRLATEYGIAPPRARIPLVRQFIDREWLPDLKARYEPSNYQRTVYVARQLKATFGRERLVDLTPRMCERWRDRRAQTVSANQLHEDFVWLRRMLRAARAAGYLRTDPTASVKLPRRTKQPDRILTAEEEATLLPELRGPGLRGLVAFALQTLLRLGDLCALTWDQVDIAHRELRLSQSKTQEPIIQPLNEAALAILRAQPPGVGKRPVFVSNRNRGYSRQTASHLFLRACVRAGITGLRFQDLRHTAAVRLLRAGWDIPTVGRLLGHRPPYRTTLRYVGHADAHRSRLALDALDPQHRIDSTG